MAKHYSEKPIEKWNVNDFVSYMDDLHQELFGIPYAPMRSWSAERGLLGNAIGTTKKAGKHDKEVIKRFIDETFRNYSPTQQYPGTSFMFMYTYRQQDLQRITKDVQQRKLDEKKSEEISQDQSSISDWLNS